MNPEGAGRQRWKRDGQDEKLLRGVVPRSLYTVLVVLLACYDKRNIRFSLWITGAGYWKTAESNEIRETNKFLRGILKKIAIDWSLYDTAFILPINSSKKAIALAFSGDSTMTLTSGSVPEGLISAQVVPFTSFSPSVRLTSHPV
jgi:hypothetical protein